MVFAMFESFLGIISKLSESRNTSGKCSGSDGLQIMRMALGIPGFARSNAERDYDAQVESSTILLKPALESPNP